MVVGNGDIASAIEDKEDFIYFASGVSNSSCFISSYFEREFNLLLNQTKHKTLVYFSSLSIYEKDTHYTRHKKRMEGAVRTHFKRYCIIRIGNITWGYNPCTIINTFKRQIKDGEESTIEEGYKYLCTKDELRYWLKLIPNFNTEMNITGERILIKDLYERVKLGYYD